MFRFFLELFFSVFTCSFLCSIAWHVHVLFHSFFYVFTCSFTCLHNWPFPRTVGQNSQEYRRKYWAIRSSVRSFARTAHSSACSGLLTSLAHSSALTRSLVHSLSSLPRSWENELLMSQNDLVLSHSAAIGHRKPWAGSGRRLMSKRSNKRANMMSGHAKGNILPLRETPS